MMDSVTLDFDDAVASQNIALSQPVQLRFRHTIGSYPYSQTDGTLYVDDLKLVAGDPRLPMSPQILSHPASVSTNAGSSFVLTVAATGTPLLRYQWKKNNTDLANQTTAVLAFNVASLDDTGSYAVVVSNPAGNVTSLPAQVTILSEDEVQTGLPSSWKLRFGLDPAKATGDHGPEGDPDGDGRTNLIEYQESTHPLVADSERSGRLRIVTTSPSPALLGTAYDWALSATGGVPPYRWRLVDGSGPPQFSRILQNGLLVDPAGAISGVPSQPGIRVAMIEVSDSDGRHDTTPLAVGVFSVFVHVSKSRGSDVTGTGAAGAPFATFAKAFQTAEGTPSAPVAILAEQGAYAGLVQLEPNESLYGGFKTGDFAIRNSLSYATSVDGTGVPTALAMADSTLLDGVTVRDAEAFGISSATLTPTVIANCVVRANGKYDRKGSGISLTGSNPVLIHTDVYDNRASYYHGGTFGGGVLISNAGAALVSNRIFANHKDAGGPGVVGYGCGISITGSAAQPPYIGWNLIANNQLWANNFTAGAGIYCTTPGTIIEGNTLVGNRNLGIGYSGNSGGAIYALANGRVTIQNNLIVGNDGYSQAGGVHLAGAGYVAHNTFAFNQAAGGGGGINFSGGSGAVVANNLFFKNKNFDVYEPTVSTLTLVNNLFFGNTSGHVFDNNAAALTDISQVNDLPGASGNLGSDPLTMVLATDQRLAATYDRFKGVTAFTTTTSTHPPRAYVGRIVRFRINQAASFYILDNTTNRFIVTGDITSVDRLDVADAPAVTVEGDTFDVYDFHLATNSPATGKGSSEYVTAQDLDHDPRDGASDIGADETTIATVIMPEIKSQPQTMVVALSSRASFQIIAAGTAPLTYQWKKNGEDILGANSGTLVIANAAASDAGSYTATVRNAAGSVTSNPAVLTVTALAQQTLAFGPLPDRVLTDAPFTLVATASSGLPVGFSWVSGPARVANGIVTLTGAGTVSIRATQLGNASFEAATPVLRSFKVSLPPPAQVIATPGSPTGIMPLTTGIEGLQYTLLRQPSSGLVTLDSRQFLYTPPTAFAGITDFAYQITDTITGAQTEVRVFLAVQLASPVFSLDELTYSVSEAAGLLIISIRKNISAPGRVGLKTINGSARVFEDADGDFSLQQTFLDFDGPETNKLAAITLINDLAYEGNESFVVEITAESPGATVAFGASRSTVTIVDDDSRYLSAYQKEPVPLPSRDARIKVNTNPPGSGGFWRFVGERPWRAGGTTSDGLPEGTFEIEFKPANGYGHPLAMVIDTTHGNTTIIEGFYTSTSGARQGDLSFLLEGTILGGWKFIEEADAAYRASGTKVTGLNIGTYTVQFKPVDGLLPPGIMNVEVRQNNAPEVHAVYSSAVTATTDRTKPAVTPFGTANYSMVGEITRGDGAVGTGFVVRERVALTAGHVVFDQKTFGDVSRVRWFFQKHRGTHQPPPQVPRGWLLNEGYASQRRIDGTKSSVFSQELDAAALFFTEPAGRGGFGGYLASAEIRSEWLTGIRDAVITGYPMDGIASSDQEKIHETPIRQIGLTQVLGLPHGTLYTSSDLLSYPGNSGGPYSIRYKDGKFYPAGIFVAVDRDQIYVKAIDPNVVNLIELADQLSLNPTNATSGGVSPLGVRLGDYADDTGLLEMNLTPVAANEAGAGWRFKGGDPSYQVGAATRAIVLPFDFELEFKSVKDFITPANLLVSVAKGTTNSLTVRYRRVQTVDLPAIPNQTVGAPPLTLAGISSSGLPVRYELVSGPGTITGSLLTVTTSGRVTVRARQDGNEDYGPAFAERSFDILTSSATEQPRLLYSVHTGLQLVGKSGAIYRIETTTNLSGQTVWVPWTTITADTAAVVIPATLPVMDRTRFYRAVATP